MNVNTTVYSINKKEVSIIGNIPEGFSLFLYEIGNIDVVFDVDTSVLIRTEVTPL